MKDGIEEETHCLSEFANRIALLKKDYQLKNMLSRDVEGCVFLAKESESSQMVVIKYLSSLDDFYSMKKTLRLIYILK